MSNHARVDEAGGDGPLTVVVTWKIKPGCEKDFEVWHRGISAAAFDFPGHLGISVLRPTKPSGEYVVIFHFDTYEHLHTWQESEVRKEWLKRAALFQADEPSYRMESGLEFWFTPPAGEQHPPRWKMSLVAMLAIYPLVNVLGIVFGPLLNGLSPWVAGLVITPVTILLMTYLVMPFLTRVFARWLFIRPQESDREAKP